MEGGAMSVNPDSIPRYAEYPAEMDPTPLDCMESCKHSPACRRAFWLPNEEPQDITNKELADMLECGECCEWEG